MVGSVLGFMLCGLVLLGRWIYYDYKRITTESAERAYMVFYNATVEECEDPELERIARQFVTYSAYQPRFNELMSTELNYITGGNQDVQLTDDQKVDLIMSRFGKLSWVTLHQLARFGGSAQKLGDTDGYTVSIRVMQCVESNLLSKTGDKIMFGASQESKPHADGTYCGAHIWFYFGCSYHSAVRIYESISLPFQELTREDLTNFHC